MIIINKKFTPNAFAKYVRNMPWRFWNRKVDKLVFHHTSSPVEIWAGSASMLHYYNLYKSRGWKVGPHIFIAPDGIWLFTDMRKQGKHAGPIGNKGSIGIEIVGNYKNGPPTDKKLCQNIAIVTKVLMDKFNIRWYQIAKHTDFDPNTFCCETIDRFWLSENLEKYYPEEKQS